MCLSEFHERGYLTKELGLLFIASIPMKAGAESFKDFCPISHIGSLCKIVAKILAGGIQKLLPSIISKS